MYDLKKRANYQITKGLRATNPDWSHDGQKLVFVIHSDGLTNLYTLTLDEFVWMKDKKLWHTQYYDLQNHILVEKIPDDKKKKYIDISYIGISYFLHKLYIKEEVS